MCYKGTLYIFITINVGTTYNNDWDKEKKVVHNYPYWISPLWIY